MGYVTVQYLTVYGQNLVTLLEAPISEKQNEVILVNKFGSRKHNFLLNFFVVWGWGGVLVLQNNDKHNVVN